VLRLRLFLLTNNRQDCGGPHKKSRRFLDAVGP
jgi:hypothetical protein